MSGEDLIGRKLTFEQFMNEAKILIVDENFTYRVALKQTLVSYGALNNNIVATKTIREARALMDATHFNIVFSDFILKDGIGTSLIGDRKDFIFILVSSVASQAAVAKAAEVEVDQFIFKPYSQAHLKTVLEGVIKVYSDPSESNQYIDDGKEFLSMGEFDKATMMFEKAKNDPDAYARASSYLGEINKIKNELDGAYRNFREGLTATEVHFRCLMGMFNILQQTGRAEESYSVLKDILLHFPEAPERLIQGIDLAIKTKHFVDIEEFYEVFKLMYEKPQSLMNYMSSGLLINGHYHLRHENQPAAMESFIRGITVGQGHDKFTMYVREKLVHFGMENRLDEVMKEVEDRKTAA
jgi:tetratricopeptide (TPR) repeat protein